MQRTVRIPQPELPKLERSAPTDEVARGLVAGLRGRRFGRSPRPRHVEEHCSRCRPKRRCPCRCRAPRPDRNAARAVAGSAHTGPPSPPDGHPLQQLPFSDCSWPLGSSPHRGLARANRSVSPDIALGEHLAFRFHAEFSSVEGAAARRTQHRPPSRRRARGPDNTPMAIAAGPRGAAEANRRARADRGATPTLSGFWRTGAPPPAHRFLPRADAR